eukprot:14686015-Ditylum_brightwellii.AAC.1
MVTTEEENDYQKNGPEVYDHQHFPKLQQKLPGYNNMHQHQHSDQDINQEHGINTGKRNEQQESRSGNQIRNTKHHDA